MWFCIYKHGWMFIIVETIKQVAKAAYSMVSFMFKTKEKIYIYTCRTRSEGIKAC